MAHTEILTARQNSRMSTEHCSQQRSWFRFYRWLVLFRIWRDFVAWRHIMWLRLNKLRLIYSAINLSSNVYICYYFVLYGIKDIDRITHNNADSVFSERMYSVNAIFFYVTSVRTTSNLSQSGKFTSQWQRWISRKFAWLVHSYISCIKKKMTKALIDKGCFSFSDTVDTNVLGIQWSNKNRTILVSTCVTKWKAFIVSCKKLTNDSWLFSSNLSVIGQFLKATPIVDRHLWLRSDIHMLRTL